MTTITFYNVSPGIHEDVSAGQTVTASLPAGCVLRKKSGALWAPIESPYLADVACSVRVDCDTYAGSPLVATLEVG